MCGIVGVLGFNSNTEKYNTYLSKCCISMKHRGPDDSGLWFNNENYSAAFVRLSIRDLSLNGHQPMVSSCGNYVITFNGEIYNSNNYINQLKNLGVVFKSSSDTEVLLYALIHFGIKKVLAEFDGMFVFSFYNLQQNKLIIARDRVGIKPLYIGYNSNYLIYSSQYDHIINIDFIKDNTLDYQALGNYLSFGYMLASEGIVNKTFSLPQGHYLETSNTGFTLHQYYNFTHSTTNKRIDVEELLSSSTIEQLVSDVPVGTFLSGGVDSPLINFWANKKQQVKAFTIGNETNDLDESYYAKEFAKKIGVEHHFKRITENDFLELLNDNFKAFSEPFADFSSIPTMLVSKMAKEHLTVILSGDGPDELFWGYNRNVIFPAKAKLYQHNKFSLAFKKLLGKENISKRYFTSKSLSHFYLQSLQIHGSEAVMPNVYLDKINTNKAYSLLPEHLVQPKNEEDVMQMVRWLEMNIHLQRILLKVDRVTMYYSLESRVPYLSNSVLDYASTLSYNDCIKDGQGKMNLKNILENKVPKEWVYKKKKGFDVPMRNWISKEIKQDVHNTIMNMPNELATVFDMHGLEDVLLNEYDTTNRNSNHGFIWAVYSLVKWHQIHRSSSALKG